MYLLWILTFNNSPELPGKNYIYNITCTLEGGNKCHTQSNYTGSIKNIKICIKNFKCRLKREVGKDLTCTY